MESKGIQWRGGLSKPIGLNRIDSKNGKEITFKHNPSDPTSLINDKVYSIYRDKKEIFGSVHLMVWISLMRKQESFLTIVMILKIQIVYLIIGSGLFMKIHTEIYGLEQ